MSRKKECHYFCHQDIDLQLFERKFWPVRSLEDYQNFFHEDGITKVWGESSPMYLYYTQAAQRILDKIPECRMIAVLRDPVDRAFSAYTHAVRDELEPLPFLDAISAEDQRLEEGSITPLQAYVECGKYGEKLAPYFERFSRDQILVIPYSEVRRCLPSVLRQVCKFLGVDQDYQFEIKPRLNRSGVPKRRWIQRMVQSACDDAFPYNIIKRPFTNHAWIRTVKGIEFWNYRLMKLDEADRMEVLPMFREDARKLDLLLGSTYSDEWGLNSNPSDTLVN